MARVCQRCNHSNLTEAKFCLQCGAMLEQEVENAGDPLVGKILMGRYRVLKILGEGGMGKVYAAEQKMGTAVRRVAIKTLHTELGQDPQLVARFLRECETVIELHHPNTVQFFDFGEMEDKTLFIVMEFIEGEDLAHVLQRGVLDATRCDRILIQVCGSLNEAHQRGIVHRDLKPENVLLTQRGGQADFVKVLDFGIAKRNEAEDESKAKLTKQGTVLGTPPYMSPEQFSGQALDLRSDIYSLGVMTYEMVTGHLPFEARTPWEWATKHLTQPPTPIETYPGGAALAPNKKAAILRALAKNRDERQGSVIEFMQEFTGLHDASAAWTMATSTGMRGGITAQQVNAAMAHTQPQPAVQPSQYGYGMPGATPSFPSPPHGQPMQPMVTPSHGQAAMPYAVQPAPSGGGTGKWIALGLVGVVLLGAVGAGAYFAFGGADPAPTPPTALTTPPVPVPGVGSNAGTPPTPIPTPVPTPIAAPVDAGAPAPVDAGTTPVTAETTMTEPRVEADQPSPAEIERARAAVRDAEAALGRQDIEGAVRALSQAQRAVGRSHSVVAGVRGNLTRMGGRAVGILIQQNKCSAAQALYRQLRTVGADSGARGQFVPGYCDRP